MTGLYVIGFFVVLGLGVVFTAMRGGPRNALKGPESSRASRKLTAVGVAVVVLVFGVGLPTLVLTDNNDDRSKKGNGGLELTAAQKHGRELFARNCSSCHTLGDANAVAQVGPDLDVLRPQAPLVVNAIEQGRARGQGQMPAQLLNGEDARNVASYVAKVAGR
jgi:mono/diheme cytochrome c family protein